MAHLFSNNFREEHDYLQLSQPKPSQILLSDNVYFSYEKSPCSDGCFKWVQPLQWVVKDERSQWNRLILENNQNSEILKHTQNSNCDECFNTTVDNCFCYNDLTINTGCSSDRCFNKKYKILPTNEESTIELYSDFYEKSLEIFYIAKQNFNASVQLNYFKNFEDSFFESTYNQLSKDHFLNLNNDSDIVKIAFRVHSENLKSEKDIGYFKPNRLATNKFDYVVDNKFYDTRFISNSAITQDRECVDGIFVDKFNVFKNKSLSVGRESFQPFKFKKITFKNKDRDCMVDCNFDSELEGMLYEYQEDVFGNQYSLYKKIFGENTIYSKTNNVGRIWIKLVGTSALKNITDLDGLLQKYKKFYFESGLYGELFNEGVREFKVFYDTLFLKLENNFIFEKVNFNFNELVLTSTESFYIAGSLSEAVLIKNLQKVVYSYVYGGELFLGLYDLNHTKLCGTGTNYGLCDGVNGKIMHYNEQLNRLSVVVTNNNHLDFYIFKLVGDGFELLDRVVLKDVENLKFHKLIKGKLLDNEDYFLVFENSTGSIFPIIINKV